MPAMKSEVFTDEALVQLESLQLLQKTVDYLNRLPVVPMTRALCREIEAHLVDPRSAAVKRAAMDVERRATTRIAQRYSPAGELTAEIVVTPESVSYKFPLILTMRSLEGLRTGDTMDFQKTN